MFNKKIHKRIKIVLLVIILCFILIIGKVFYIQVIDYNKLNNLAIVKYYKQIINGDRYFRYDEITLYKLKSFDTFLNMIDMGYITLYINLGIYKSGIKKGQCHDYGVRFDIKEKYVPMIYNKLAR